MNRRFLVAVVAATIAAGCGGGSSSHGGADATPDAPSLHDSGAPDVTVGDTSAPDSTVQDAPEPDTSPGEPDSTPPDSAPTDAGPIDAADAGPPDATEDGADSGATDTGGADAVVESGSGDSSTVSDGPLADATSDDTSLPMDGGDAAKPADASPDALASYPIGGTLTGLASGEGVVLEDNGGDDLTLMSTGGFTFATRVPSGGAYDVTVLTQPSSPISQTCAVTGGTGTATGNVTSVSVSCTTNTFTVGGTLSGLGAGDTVVLQDNAGDNLTLTSNGTFTFMTPVASGTAYDVTVLTQPSGQTCTVSAGSGTIGGGDVTGIVVNCASTATYTVGGTLSGLASGDTLILEDNGASNQIFLASNGSFAFPTPVASGTTYVVTVGANPATPTPETCTVMNGNGTVGTANVTTIEVHCQAEASCSAILENNPSTPSGMYTITPGGTSLTVYCDMSTAPGGWTVIFVPSSSDLDSESISYTVNSSALLSSASQMLFAYRDAGMNVLLDWASFGITANLRTQSPFEYAEMDEAVSVSISGAAPVNTTLRYGYANWPDLCTDAWDAPTTAWGRVCIENTTAPFYNGFAVGEGNYCPNSEQHYDQSGFPCSSGRQFTIAVR